MIGERIMRKNEVEEEKREILKGEEKIWEEK